MEPARLAHDSADAEGFALQLGLIVFRQIPRIRNAAALCVERKTFVVALARGGHPMPPVFAHHRNPVAGEIDRRHGLPGWRATLSPPLLCGLGDREGSNDQYQNDCNTHTNSMFLNDRWSMVGGHWSVSDVKG